MSFRVADFPDDMTPSIVQKANAAAAAWKQGGLLVVNASNQYAECGADPAAVAAVALNPVGADASGFNILGTLGFPPGYTQAAWVGGDVSFRAQYVGSLPAADGGSYGVVKDSDGLWKVDFAEVTALVVKLVGRFTNSPENQAEVRVKFLPAVVQII